MSAPAAAIAFRGTAAWRRNLRLHGWTVAVWLVLLALVPYWRSLSQQDLEFDLQAVAIDALPLCFAAMAQAVIVISGGIDLSIGSMMGVVNVLSAKHMIGMSFREALAFSLLILVLTALAGAFTGLIITLSRIPDIVVTLGMLFVWQGVALWIMEIPGGGAPLQYSDLALGSVGSTLIPNALVVVLVAFALVWLPLRWLRPGLAIYAVGSNRTAAYLSGIGVARTRVGAYMLGGVFTGLGGLALTASSGIGDPNAGVTYTLNSVAAVVLGGVALVGGVGGLIGPIAAALVLTMSKIILLLRGTDPNYANVYQGALIIFVVVIGGLLARKTRS
ncbi:MAG: ABC transporter permease [Thermoleophilia bacterium]|nr:ABC transporter permease [Thermoleophilia bacterium]